MLKMMNFIKEIKNNASIKSTTILLSFSLLLKLLFTLCSIFDEYLYIIEFINWRLFLILCILVLLQGLLNLPFIKDLQEEMSIFNEGPANKSSFIAYLRKYHFFLMFSACLLYSLAVTYFIEEPLISYSLGILAFVSLILYQIQFVVYTITYIRKSKSILKNKKGHRNIVTSSNLKPVLIICVECMKNVISIVLGVELVYKFTHGGMNEVPPWRQHYLNKTFPNDKTKVWTETKAAMALDNRAMGLSHDATYDSLDDKITVPKKK